MQLDFEERIDAVTSKLSIEELNQHNWDILEELSSSSSVQLKSTHYNFRPCWMIEEKLDGETIFKMARDKGSHNRDSQIDLYGLLGLSLINLKDRRCILTEGVSDYFTAKLLFPEYNVLGLVTLSGTALSKQIFLNLFDDFAIFSDNDSAAENNTGTNNVFRIRKLLVSYNKKVDIYLPQGSLKDLTANFVFNLKINGI